MKQYLKRLLFPLGLLVCAGQLWAAMHEDHPYHFTISKHAYKHAEIYQIQAEDRNTYPGSIKKSAFRIRTNYDLSDKDGWQSTGITRILSLGSLYHWAKDIDVYDTRGVRFGLIDGSMATLESARFDLYEYDDDGNYEYIGSAYANPTFNKFTVFPNQNDPRPIAELNRNYANHTWEVSVHYPEKIDDRLIRTFAGFVVDHQDKFLKSDDNE